MEYLDKEDNIMKKFSRVQLNNIGRIAKEGCKYLIYGLAAALVYSKTTNDTTETVRYYGEADYGDAVKGVMDSKMSGYYKDAVMCVLPKDGTSELYKAVIAIANSNGSDYYKAESIKHVCARTK